MIRDVATLKGSWGQTNPLTKKKKFGTNKASDKFKIGSSSDSSSPPPKEITPGYVSSLDEKFTFFKAINFVLFLLTESY